MLNYLDKERRGAKHEFMHNGDKMSQREFSKIYSKLPEPYKAELVAGIVYEPPPPTLLHSVGDLDLSALLRYYTAYTPGTQSGHDCSVILSDEDQVQPDSFLRVLPELGGQSANWRRKIKGAPELVAEVSFSSRSIDLHIKKERYAKFGVKEYIIFCVEPSLIQGLNLASGEMLPMDENGVIRSEIFPGLWIDARSLSTGDYKSAFETLSLGLQSSQHKAFVDLLASRMT
jgi:Uma2 family endonuclease